MASAQTDSELDYFSDDSMVIVDHKGSRKCNDCKLKFHQPLSCAEYFFYSDGSPDKTLQEIFILSSKINLLNTISFCPTCSVPVFKYEGCDQMNCGNCGTCFKYTEFNSYLNFFVKHGILKFNIANCRIINCFRSHFENTNMQFCVLCETIVPRQKYSYSKMSEERKSVLDIYSKIFKRNNRRVLPLKPVLCQLCRCYPRRVNQFVAKIKTKLRTCACGSYIFPQHYHKCFNCFKMSQSKRKAPEVTKIKFLNSEEKIFYNQLELSEKDEISKMPRNQQPRYHEFECNDLIFTRGKRRRDYVRIYDWEFRYPWFKKIKNITNINLLRNYWTKNYYDCQSICDVRYYPRYKRESPPSYGKMKPFAINQNPIFDGVPYHDCCKRKSCEAYHRAKKLTSRYYKKVRKIDKTRSRFEKYSNLI